MGGGTDGAVHTTDRDGNPNVFRLDEDEGKLGLGACSADPLDGWDSDDRFVFRLRKKLSSSEA